MKALRSFLLLLLFGSRAIASGADPIRNIVDSWPWNEGRVEIVEPEADAEIVVNIAYKRISVVDDTDSYGIRFHKKKNNRFGGIWGYGKSRCGPDGGCSGAPRLEKITKEGYKIVFNLTWSNKEQKEGAFTRSFDCKWNSIQRFQKDGFEIIVTTTKK